MKQTHSLVLVASALLSDPAARHWGYELSRESGVRSGVMYPILTRMLNEGWLEDHWESEQEVAGLGRPPRRYYLVTEIGLGKLGGVLARARMAQSPLAGNRPVLLWNS